MAGYSLNPEDYLTLEQLEYLKDHAVRHRLVMKIEQFWEAACVLLVMYGIYVS